MVILHHPDDFAPFARLRTQSPLPFQLLADRIVPTQRFNGRLVQDETTTRIRRRGARKVSSGNQLNLQRLKKVVIDHGGLHHPILLLFPFEIDRKPIGGQPLTG